MNPSSISDKRFWGQTGGILASSGLAMIIDIVIGLTIARLLPQFEYGKISYYLWLQGTISLLLGFGLATKTITDIAGWDSSKSEHETEKIFYSLLAIRVLSVGVLIICGILMMLFTGEVLFSLLANNVSLTLTNQSFLALLQAKQKISAYIGIILFRPVIYLILIFISLPNRAVDVYIIFNRAWIITLLLSVTIIGAYRVIRRPKFTHFSLPYIKKSVNFLSQFHSSWIVEAIYLSYVIIYLGSFSKYLEVAILSIAIGLTQQFTNMLTPVIMTTLYPNVVKLYITAKNGLIGNAIQDFFSAVIAIALVQAITFGLFPELIVITLYSDKYADAVQLLVFFTPLIFLLPLSRMTLLTLVALERTKSTLFTLAMRLVALVTLCTFTIIFIRGDISKIIAIIYNITCLFTVAVQLYQIREVTSYRIPILKFTLIGTLLVIFGLLIKQFLPDLAINLLSEGYKALIIIIFGFVLSFFILSSRLKQKFIPIIKSQ